MPRATACRPSRFVAPCVRPVALVLALLVALPGVASAGAPGAEAERAAWAGRRQRARTVRAVGLGLSGAGVGGVLLGGVLLGAAGQQRYEDGARFQFAGGVTLAASVAALFPGVALAIVGQRALDTADWRLRALSSLVATPLPGGGVYLGLSTRF